MDTTIISTLISSFFGILIPFIIWFLNKKERNDEILEIDQHLKRLELLDSMSKMASDKRKENVDLLIDNEIEQSISLLAKESEENSEEKSLESEAFESLAKWRKQLLLFKPANAKVLAIQIIFFYLLYSFASSIYSYVFGDALAEIREGVREELDGDMDSVNAKINMVLIAISMIQLGIVFLLKYLGLKMQRKHLASSSS